MHASHINVVWTPVWRTAFSYVQFDLHKLPVSKRKRGLNLAFPAAVV